MKKPTPKPKQKRNASKRSLKLHAKASLLHIVPARATGRRLAYGHTSHGGLLLILILGGITLFVGLASVQANAESISHSIDVTAVVNGPPPTVGAVITSPPNQTRTNTPQLTVTTSCPQDTYVAIYNSGAFSGSSPCVNGISQIAIQLQPGSNVLQAQDYDFANQPGPATGQIVVEYDVSPSPSVTPVHVVDHTITKPSVPAPAANTCAQDPAQQAAPSRVLWLRIDCAVRNVFVGEELQLPVSISGGTPPYALSVNWGDGSAPAVNSFSQPNRYTLQHIYQTAGTHQPVLSLADAAGGTYRVQILIVVNQTGIVAGNSSDDSVFSSIKSSWIDATIPIYWGLAILIGGFWVGDVFQRFTGTKSKRRIPIARRAR